MSLRQEEKWTENCDNASVAASSLLSDVQIINVWFVNYGAEVEGWSRIMSRQRCGLFRLCIPAFSGGISMAGSFHHSYRGCAEGGGAVSVAPRRQDNHYKNRLKEFGLLQSG